MRKEIGKMKNSSKIEDDLCVEEAIFLIEWGYDITDSRINQNSKKKIEG